VEIGDFATISARCTIFSSSDDYSGATMGNATVPDIYRDTTDAPVRIGAHAMIGAGSILLPGVTLGESACVGAMSLVKTDVAAFTIVAGVPARPIGRRRAEHRTLADRLLQEES
jgi:galactoside O-acetyltransferase